MNKEEIKDIIGCIISMTLLGVIVFLMLAM